MRAAKRLRNLKPSYIREILSAASRPEVISLAGGLPSESCFPMSEMADSLQALTVQPSLFQYGETRGYPPLVAFLQDHYCHDDHELMISTGSQQALDLVARALLNPGDRIVMESPGYLGAIQVFSLAEARMLSVRQLSDGPDLDQLQSLFSDQRVRLFYAVPDFHNPTGVCWSLATRKSVAALCRQYDVWLLEDCPYRQIRFSGELLPLVSSFCPERSIVLRSFSKTIAPGMRFGIAAAPPKIIEVMLLVKQTADLHSTVPLQSVLLDVLSHQNFPQHLQRISAAYGVRYQALRSAIDLGLDLEKRINDIEGGMFIWLGLPGVDVMELAEKAIRQNVAVVPGDVFYPDRSLAESYLRLNFSHTEPQYFGEAVERLARCLS